MREQLLLRLEAVGQAVEESGNGVALLGLGSAGMALDRLDEYSDLDIFVIARPGYKRYFLDSLAWLTGIRPIVFSFLNTADGYKLLFDDGIFCEMAVFEEPELRDIPYSQARIVWQDEGIAFAFTESNNLPPLPVVARTVEWLVGEALSNLFVGLGRFRRGEKLTAMRFIQEHAVNHIVDLAHFIEAPQNDGRDAFNKSRRFEQRFPKTAVELPTFMQGYEKSPQSARAILGFLDQHFLLNEGMKQAILSYS